MRAPLACIVLTAGLVLSNGPIAEACRCPKPPLPENAHTLGGAVFSGRVTETEQVDEDRLVVTFEVNRIWTGPIGKRAEVVTHPGGSMCGFPFRVGGEYLVYASFNRNNEPGSALRTDICTRTAMLDDAEEDLEALGDGRTPEQVREAALRMTGSLTPVAGSPVAIHLGYRGGMDRWDAKITHSGNEVVLINSAFLEVIDSRGRRLELRHITAEHQQKQFSQPFNVRLPLSRIADLSEPGYYMLRWGMRDVLEHELPITIIRQSDLSRIGGNK